jgi:hypothetical protein
MTLSVSQTVLPTTANDRVIHELWTGKDGEGSDRSLRIRCTILEFSWKTHSGQSVSRPRFEQMTSRINQTRYLVSQFAHLRCLEPYLMTSNRGYEVPFLSQRSRKPLHQRVLENVGDLFSIGSGGGGVYCPSIFSNANERTNHFHQNRSFGAKICMELRKRYNPEYRTFQIINLILHIKYLSFPSTQQFVKSCTN